MKVIIDPAFKITEWQQEFVDRYIAAPAGMGVLVAPPGSGKTAVAMHLAMSLLNQNVIDRVASGEQGDSRNVILSNARSTATH